jgi:Transposase
LADCGDASRTGVIILPAGPDDEAQEAKRHSEEQIIANLKEHEAGMKTADLCRKHGISEASFSNWKAKYAGLESVRKSPRNVPGVFGFFLRRHTAVFELTRPPWPSNATAHHKASDLFTRNALAGEDDEYRLPVGGRGMCERADGEVH